MLSNFNFEDDFEEKAKSAGNIDWKKYYSFTDLNAFIERLAEKNEFARIVNIGKSFEGRDMKVLAIDKVNILSLV